MEFKFSVNEILKQPIIEINHNLIPPGFSGDRRALWDTIGKVSEIVNAMGEASAVAQGLTKPITTAERLRNSEQTVYLLTDPNANNGKGAVTGMLKTGKKGLYVFDRNGTHYQVTPSCVLDFYVHESRQRTGLGKQLFEHMLEKESVEPVKMAIDRPSDKFLGFLNKHYTLNNPIKQMNNYVVFDDFFTATSEKNGVIDNNNINNNNSGGKKSSANGLQNYASPLGRYGAPRPPCSMGQIIHNQTSTIQKSAEPAGPNITQSSPNMNYGGIDTNLENYQQYYQQFNNPYQIMPNQPNLYYGQSGDYAIQNPPQNWQNYTGGLQSITYLPPDQNIQSQAQLIPSQNIMPLQSSTQYIQPQSQYAITHQPQSISQFNTTSLQPIQSMPVLKQGISPQSQITQSVPNMALAQQYQYNPTAYSQSVQNMHPYMTQYPDQQVQSQANEVQLTNAQSQVQNNQQAEMAQTSQQIQSNQQVQSTQQMQESQSQDQNSQSQVQNPKPQVQNTQPQGQNNQPQFQNSVPQIQYTQSQFIPNYPQYQQYVMPTNSQAMMPPQQVLIQPQPSNTNKEVPPNTSNFTIAPQFQPNSSALNAPYATESNSGVNYNPKDRQSSAHYIPQTQLAIPQQQQRVENTMQPVVPNMAQSQTNVPYHQNMVQPQSIVSQSMMQTPPNMTQSQGMVQNAQPMVPYTQLQPAPVMNRNELQFTQPVHLNQITTQQLPQPIASVQTMTQPQLVASAPKIPLGIEPNLVPQMPQYTYQMQTPLVPQSQQNPIRPHSIWTNNNQRVQAVPESQYVQQNRASGDYQTYPSIKQQTDEDKLSTGVSHSNRISLPQQKYQGSPMTKNKRKTDGLDECNAPKDVGKETFKDSYLGQNEPELTYGYPPQLPKTDSQPIAIVKEEIINSSPKLERPRSLSIQPSEEHDSGAEQENLIIDDNDTESQVPPNNNTIENPDEIAQEIEDITLGNGTNESDDLAVSNDNKSNGKRTPGLTEQGFFDLKFYHNKLW